MAARIGKFDWERLMLVSPLPWPTRSILLALAVFMSEDGSNARPGIPALAGLTRKRTVLISHLKAAVDAGYLAEVERGGYRRVRGAVVPRVSEYAATVPFDIYERRHELLNLPPWKRSDDDGPMFGQSDVGNFVEGSADRTLDDAERSADRTLDKVEGPVLQDQGPADRTPSITYQQSEELLTNSSSVESPPTGRRARRSTTKKSTAVDDPTFAEWWTTYPRHVEKARASRAYTVALAAVDGNAALLLAGAKRYADEVRGRELKWVSYPTTWLTGERWNDELTPAQRRNVDGPRDGRHVSQSFDDVHDLIAKRKAAQQQ